MTENHDDDHTHTYKPAVLFPDQSPSFAYGFEAGKTDAALKQLAPGEALDECLMSANRELYGLLARHNRCDLIISDITDNKDWMHCTFTKRPEEQATLN